MSKFRDAVNTYIDFLYQQPRTIMQAAANAAATTVVDETKKKTSNAAANWNIETYGINGGVGIKDKPFRDKHGTEGVGMPDSDNRVESNPQAIDRLKVAIHEAIWSKNQTRILLSNNISEENEGKSGVYHANAMIDYAAAKAVVAGDAAMLARKQAVAGHGPGFDWSKVS